MFTRGYLSSSDHWSMGAILSETPTGATRPTPTRLGLNETQQQRWVAVKQFWAPNVCVCHGFWNNDSIVMKILSFNTSWVKTIIRIIQEAEKFRFWKNSPNPILIIPASVVTFNSHLCLADRRESPRYISAGKSRLGQTEGLVTFHCHPTCCICGIVWLIHFLKKKKKNRCDPKMVG